MIYYNNLPLFDYVGNQTAHYFTPVQMPTTHRGLIGVLVVLFVRLLLVALITVTFLINTDNTRLGNVWHTIAQLVSDETNDTLQDLTMLSDDEVEKRLREDGKLVPIPSSGYAVAN